MVGNLKWWLLFLCSLVGLAFAVVGGQISEMWRVDRFKVSFVTLTVYFIMSAFIGWLTWRHSRGDRTGHIRYQEGYEYSVTLMTLLGLIGTVIGFMGLLFTSFDSLGSSDVSEAQAAIKNLTSGSSTALVNTLVGLLGAVGLKLQVINLNLAVSRG